mmetsp:Transcript_27086/g.68319  ORF Transcript_27086/g.68319 Transcript_27086/m.68319 type:complete len:214 (+) Transcript_27086:1486-2127(+)
MIAVFTNWATKILVTQFFSRREIVAGRSQDVMESSTFFSKMFSTTTTSDISVPSSSTVNASEKYSSQAVRSASFWSSVPRPMLSHWHGVNTFSFASPAYPLAVLFARYSTATCSVNGTACVPWAASSSAVFGSVTIVTPPSSLLQVAVLDLSLVSFSFTLAWITPNAHAARMRSVRKTTASFFESHSQVCRSWFSHSKFVGSGAGSTRRACWP